MAIAIAAVQKAFDGYCEIQHEIGRGAMATVFKARDLDGRDVAVKVLRPEFAVSLIGDRFHREIAILSRLNHPNILPLYESGERDRLIYFTMPLASGGTLRDRIEAGPVAIEDTARVLREVAAGLDHAHQQQVVHRDIKPENVVFMADTAVLCDFGVALAVVQSGGERISTSGLVVGTPSYMSPEQAAGLPNTDYRADIYALGCLVFEMLAGEPLFSGRSTQAVMTKQVKEPPRSIRVVRPDVPESAAAVLSEALAKSPADRPASAREFATRFSAM